MTTFWEVCVFCELLDSAAAHQVCFQIPLASALRAQKQLVADLKVKRRVRRGLTAGAASEDIFSDFIVQEDEERVGEGTEPPQRPRI